MYQCEGNHGTPFPEDPVENMERRLVWSLVLATVLIVGNIVLVVTLAN